MRVVLATRNAHKVVEVRRILAEAGLAVDLVGMDAFPDAPEVAETGLTFEENALLKARAIAQATGLPAIADDSGLAVDVLGGMPGIFSARWAGGHGDDIANLQLVLAQLSDVADGHRGAAFVCAAAIARQGGDEHVVRGELRGRLTREPRGTNGFGYDPIFCPDGERRTTAEMEPREKDAISHRGVAFRALAQHFGAIVE
ncbi:MAG: RdgB/HAM1 family non-canonical purine NTP pyrophosphatase [Actinomycetia bacterium]|nr:RdgB/HAM1 family non-canonical purine NTP pyrophosphatase [Actinomycetes bacterium]